MVLGLLRLLIPIVIIAASLFVVYLVYKEYLAYKDRQREREHERKMKREERDYDTLIESVQDQEFEEELNDER